MRIDLNADMGESYGPWQMGDDVRLLDIVTSANIACGAHAGDPDVMAKTMQMAIDKNVGIGAHPGFADLQGFGRRKIDLPLESLQNSIRYQVGASAGMARSLGAELGHIKLHGALANMTSENEAMATACFDAALSVCPDAVLIVIAATAQERAAKRLKARYACEVFADRAYNDDATLVDRKMPGAVIHDPDVAADRMASMLREGAIITQSGKRIQTHIDTICCHGDTAEAVQITATVRAKLVAQGVKVQSIKD